MSRVIMNNQAQRLTPVGAAEDLFKRVFPDPALKALACLRPRVREGAAGEL